MAHKKISALPSATGATINDILVIVISGVTYNIPISAIVNVNNNYIPIITTGSSVFSTSIMHQTGYNHLLISGSTTITDSLILSGITSGTTDTKVLTLDDDGKVYSLNINSISGGISNTIISSSNTVSFTNGSAGVIHGTWDVPIMGTIILNEANAVNGSTAMVIWSGSTNPLIVGGTIQSSSGNVTVQGIYSIYIIYVHGRFNINVFNTDGDVTIPSDVTPPIIGVLSYESVGDTTLTLNWSGSTDNIGIVGYKIYQDNVLLETLGSVLTYNVTGLTSATQYTFKIRAFDFANNESIFSNEVTPTTLSVGDITPPTQITDLALEDLGINTTPPTQITDLALEDLGINTTPPNQITDLILEEI